MTAAWLWLLGAALLTVSGRPARRRRRRLDGIVVRRRPGATPGSVRRRLSPSAGALIAAGCTGALPWLLLPVRAAVVCCLPVALLAGVVVRRTWTAGSAAAGGADDVPLTLDLLAAALRAGATPVAALRSVGRSGSSAPGSSVSGSSVSGSSVSGSSVSVSALVRVAALLSLGAPTVEAWSGLVTDPQWELVARTAARSGESGLRLAESWDKLAADLRAERRTAATARAERVSVLGLLPLAACFLPAFVCLGVVPVVVGLAGTVLHR